MRQHNVLGGERWRPLFVCLLGLPVLVYLVYTKYIFGYKSRVGAVSVSK